MCLFNTLSIFYCKPFIMIDFVQFDILSPEKIRSISVCEVVTDELYENGHPKHGGLRDPMFGVSTRRGTCTACQRTWTSCSGHFGHYELPIPVYHIGWIGEVLFWLRRICNNCGHVAPKASPKKCPTCKTKYLKFTKLNSITLKITDTNGIRDLFADEAYSYLSKANLEDVAKIRPGDFMPKNLILTVLPIPPNCVRPSPTMNGDEVRGEDDITRRLLYVLRIAKGYKNVIAEISTVKQHYKKKIQDAVHMYIDQTRMSSKHKGTQKCISDRLRGKTGRLRGTLMGKRCNFTSRTVVSGDAMLDMREVGVPKEVAEKLTVVEHVNRLNLKNLKEMCADQDPRIKYIVKKDGTRLDMATIKGRTDLQVGCSVERILKDGDLVLFNRQPSLHRMSIMCHRAKIMPIGKTFRLNLSCTTPYNADFDGDEMNLHVLQTHESRADAQELMSVAYNIMTPQSNRPVMGIVQDSLLSAFMMTKAGVTLDKSEMCNICMWIEGAELPEPKLPGPLWTGLQCMSLLFPKDFNWRDVIFKGHVLKGPLGKKALGRSHGSIIHRLYNDYGPDRTCQFINELQRINHLWFSGQGFSIGIGDMRISKETEIKVKKECADIDSKADKLRSKYSENAESKINRMLNQTRDSMGLIAQNAMSDNNCLGLMVKSGSKGSMVNILQIMACVGQQNCSGKRMQHTLNGRTLPMFNFDDNTARSRGFVKHSYIDGLTPDEYWHHTVGGREGLIDTAVKTSTTGYIQRRLVKSLESVHVANDTTVRDSQGTIIQFKYGEDGLDGMYHEMIYGPFDDIDTLDKHYCQKQWPELNNAFNMWKWNQKSRLGDKWALTVPVERILEKYRDGGSLSNPQKRNILKPILDETKQVPLAYAYILSVLTRNDTNCSKKIFIKIVDILLRKWRKSIVAPGEMVGTIAAQSVGEPTTQMTLNTFHNAGNSAKNVTLGVPRFEELINASSKMKTPSLTIFTDPGTSLQPEKAWRLKTDIQRTTIRDIMISNTYEVSQWPELDAYLELPDNKRWDIVPSPKRILHCILSRKKMIQTGITIHQIVEKLRSMPQSKYTIFAYNHIPNQNAHIFAKTYQKKNFFQCAKKIMDVTVKGSKYIPNVTIRAKGDHFAIDTEGIDLDHIKKLKQMNHRTIQCNDIFAIKKTYGIEAARSTLLTEMHKVLSFDGSYVNMRHLMVIVDWMTCYGTITALTRHGVKKRMNTSAPLKRATFEQPVEIFHQAACKGIKDTLKGISEQLLIGIEPKCGSHYNTVITETSYQTQWDNEDWQPPQEEEEDLFGDVDIWRPEPMETDGEWESHTTFANTTIPNDKQPGWQQQQPGWQQQQQPGWQQQQQPAWQQDQQPAWQQDQQPKSPTYSPASPTYSPTSAGSPVSPAYSPTSPTYSPTTAGSPVSPAYSPTSPTYSPTTAGSPVSPAYSPTSPTYSPTTAGSPVSPAYSPTSPAYSPTSPAYSPTTSKNRFFYEPDPKLDNISPTKRHKKV